MLKIFRLFAVILVSIMLSGCATRYILPEQKWEIERLEAKGKKEHYEFNLSQTGNIGKLIIYCLPPSQQLMVKNYEIQVDNYDKLEVFKFSDVEIILDAGTHIVTAKAKGVGLTAKEEILIEKEEEYILTYTGPYWIWEAGKFKEGRINTTR